MSMIKFIGIIQVPLKRHMGFKFLRLLHAVTHNQEQPENECNYIRCWMDADGTKRYSDLWENSTHRLLHFEGRAARNFTNRMNLARLIEWCRAENIKFSFVIVDNETGWEEFGEAGLISCEIKFSNGMQESVICI